MHSYYACPRSSREMSRSTLILAFIAATASAHISGGGGGRQYQVPPAAQAVHLEHHEESLGPVIRTGRYRVIQEKIIGGQHSADAYQQGPPPEVQAREGGDEVLHLDRPFLDGRPEDVAQHGQRFHYDGPNDGRRVYIYRRVHTPVRVTNGVIERLGPGQTVERWAEGGYKGAQTHNLDVYHRFGSNVFSDRVIPVKSVIGGDLL
ncbi:hypothetical protein PRIPAC_77435 [Pristionchus pacificus]|uniref:Uncharacterized protein n=1 Tax=Pristionchus pacificus TaxID=54126 RepID=A0A454XZM9_PRIPA|nr:hypothetical protein PRIPAC_77435 [Pristionchus pacificus]|eukprot:PDM78516.1 hypothetical protein PRIPAC_31095 [Pristionchus pacificus]